MGMHACQVRTDDGVWYVAYGDTVSSFVTPVFSTPGLLAEAVERRFGRYGEYAEDWCRYARETGDQFDLRRLTIFDAVGLIAELKAGRALRDDDAFMLGEFVRFLRATVLGEASGAHRAIDEFIAQQVNVLGLGGKYREHPDWSTADIVEHVEIGSYTNAWLRRRHPTVTQALPQPLTDAERKLCGRYLTNLVRLARVAGANRQRPEEIIERYHCR